MNSSKKYFGGLYQIYYKRSNFFFFYKSRKTHSNDEIIKFHSGKYKYIFYNN